MKSIANFLYIIVLMLAFTACEHKELCTDHPHKATVTLKFDWREAPEANPRGMCVFFYPIEGGVPYRYDMRGTEGGSIELRNGTYRIITYNNDAEGTQSYGVDDYLLHTFFTREGNVLEPIYGNTANYAPRADGTEDERVFICPDMMWGCAVDELVVVDGDVITLYPHELTCEYTYEILDVTNLRHVTSMCATISGMSSRLRIHDEYLDSEPVTIPFDALKGDDTTIVGHFYTFGCDLVSLYTHRMVLYVVMDDGSKYAFGPNTQRFDVTTQVHQSPDRHHVHIVISGGLELPQPIENGHGFNPSVDDWDEINVEITM
ncbi:MAG: DUF5119 domain-containing protein [Muribaculaceae bacterium]